jgi:hypothetical protein
MQPTKPVSLLRYTLEEGCWGFGTLFFFISVGIRTFRHGTVVLDSTSFLVEAGLSLVGGAIWALLMWTIILPRVRTSASAR